MRMNTEFILKVFSARVLSHNNSVLMLKAFLALEKENVIIFASKGKSNSSILITNLVEILNKVLYVM